ncbi:hypothetical protein [Streptomyces capparidis]
MPTSPPQSSSHRPGRPGGARRSLRTAAALLALLGVGAYLLVRHLTAPPSEGCSATVGEQRVEVSVEQAASAATIAAVAQARGLPERAVTIALATAMQESRLENIRHGDRDSLGLFQQRPSQGWGTPEQIMDPVYSAHEFYEALEKVPGYSRLPLTVAAQRVQRSGFPQAYAKHEPEAAVLAAAVTGRSAGGLRCTLTTGGGAGDAARVADRVGRAFAKTVAPGRHEGRVLRFAPREGGAADGRRGWALAHWAVAHAKELNIAGVRYGDREWAVEESGDGWRRNSGGNAPGGADSGDGAGGVTVVVGG